MWTMLLSILLMYLVHKSATSGKLRLYSFKIHPYLKNIYYIKYNLYNSNVYFFLIYFKSNLMCWRLQLKVGLMDEPLETRFTLWIRILSEPYFISICISKFASKDEKACFLMNKFSLFFNPLLLLTNPFLQICLQKYMYVCIFIPLIFFGKSSFPLFLYNEQFIQLWFAAYRHRKM